MNNIYNKIYSFDNLHLAYLKARKNKRYKKEILRFSANLEENLIQLQNELMWQTYTPGKYHEFFVHDPKTRLILALPFRDRVIHHALCNVIEPIFEKTFIADSFACRKNKGTIAGVKRNEMFLLSQASRPGKVYCLKMDIRKFFYSIDHSILKKQIRRKIRDGRALKLIDVIINSTGNPGIPVGNLTSQLFANIYLNTVDHYVKEELRAKHYVRYMDDMIVLHGSKEQLWQWLGQTREFLKLQHLELNEKTAVFEADKGIDFLGYRQFMTYRILRKRVMQKNFRKFSKFMKASVSKDKINISLQSLLGQCKHCNAVTFLNKIGLMIGATLCQQTSSN